MASASVVDSAFLPSASARTASRPVKMPVKHCLLSMTSTAPLQRSHMLPHAPTGLLHRSELRQHQRRLVLDDIGELSVFHDASIWQATKSIHIGCKDRQRTQVYYHAKASWTLMHVKLAYSQPLSVARWLRESSTSHLSEALSWSPSALLNLLDMLWNAMRPV